MGVRGSAQGVLFSEKTQSFSRAATECCSTRTESEVSSFNSKIPESRKRGRKSALSDDKLHELLNAYYSNYYTLRELAKMFNVSRSCVHRSLASVSREELMLAVPQLATVIL